MAASSKYAGSAGEEFEPGSDGLVLRNKLGITDPQEMAERELMAFLEAELKLSTTVTSLSKFSAQDIKDIHNDIFGDIYDWAGNYRSVDLTKDGFMFTRAVFIDQFMREYEKNVLEALTPLTESDTDSVAESLAVIHAEYILIHPFRDGNGRTGRLLLALLALQAGYDGLDYDAFSEGEQYIAAIHAAVEKKYAPLERIIKQAILP